MQNKSTPAEGKDSAQLESESALRGAACSPLDFAVLAGIRAATKAGIPPIALAVHRRDAAEDTLGGLPVMTAGTLQFDDWETGCKYLPLFGSNNVTTLEAERAFMEAFSLENVELVHPLPAAAEDELGLDIQITEKHR
jgi:hypothetical protein